MKSSFDKQKTRMLVITSLSIALVFVFTSFINLRLPLPGSGGLIHLGNVPLFIVAIIFGKRVGFWAGALGMGLFDLLSGWVSWAPFTFLIVGAMGYVVGVICEKYKQNSYVPQSFAIGIALIIKVVGYYLAEVILYGNLIAPFGSVLGNFLQVGVAAIIVIPISLRLRREFSKFNLTTKEVKSVA